MKLPICMAGTLASVATRYTLGVVTGLTCVGMPLRDVQASIDRVTPRGQVIQHPASGDTVVRRVELRSQMGDLRGQLPRLIRAYADSARAKGLTLIVEVGATWCGPCHEFERNLKKPEMIDALSGMSIVHLDANEWNAETDLASIGIPGGVMPIFAAMDTTGKAVALLRGVIDAPSLKVFFGKHRWLARGAVPGTAASSKSSPPKEVPSKEFLFRLTVRPREMATGTENVKAGVDTLDSLPNYFVYVPQNCVGKRRVPLVVYVHGGGWNSTMQLKAQRDLADKYGMILLLPNSGSPGQQDVFVGLFSKQAKTALSPSGASMRILESDNTDARGIDAAMKQVLQKYAIDPEKIAIMGFSNGGSYSLLLGRHNLDIFSRIGGLSALAPMYGEGPKNDKAKFIVSGGVAEDMVKRTVAVANELRDEGHDVETVLALRGHIALREDDNYAWSWLARSWGWTMTSSMQEKPPRVLAPETDPVLTTDMLQKMTMFWTSFMNEPDSILSVARKANQESVVIRIGQTPVTVVKVNMVALAAKYPSVANALTRAGLTAYTEEACRMAIIRVGFTRLAAGLAGPAADETVLAKNLAFRAVHDAEFLALAKTGMWTTQ